MIIPSLLILLLGLSVGSFLGACAYRIPYGVSLTGSRSFCPSCYNDLRWHELIPIISYIRSKGKCRSCKATISPIYPLTETIAVVIAITFFLQHSLTPAFIIATTFSFFMILLAVIDWQHLLIPNKIIIAGFVTIGVLQIVFFDFIYFLQSTLFGCMAGFFVLTIRLIGNRLYKKETMGMGDVKLSALLGFSVGLSGFFVTLWFAALIGTMVAIVRLFVLNQPRSHKLPFGSFLAMSAILYLLLRTTIEEWIGLWLI